MAKKKKLTKAERKEARLRKGKQWLLTYTGSPKKMNKHYRERFHVDAVTAAKDLQELGVNYTQEQLDQIKQAEEQRLRQRRMEREAKERERLAELYEDCDDRFAFIAGYTDGGAPYGVMWEEVGIDPRLPFEEKEEPVQAPRRCVISKSCSYVPVRADYIQVWPGVRPSAQPD